MMEVRWSGRALSFTQVEEVFRIAQYVCILFCSGNLEWISNRELAYNDLPLFTTDLLRRL